MENCQIFISYRRAGGEHLAGRIADKLKSLGYQVFLDVVSMKAGKFNEQIYRAIESCKDVLVILSENALDRCKDEEDFVRKEVEYAFSLNKRVIPVLTPGFRFPDTLPEKMDEIRYCEGVLTDSNYFHAVIDRIEELILSKPMGGQGYLQFLNLGLFQQASILCEKAIMENPADADAYFYTAVSMLAGKRPFLLDRATIQKIEPKVIVQSVSSETSELLKDALYLTVSDGTAKAAQVAGYLVGGKTGTAQKYPRSEGKYLVSFIGCVPADDPQVMIYVAIDEAADPTLQDRASTSSALASSILAEALPYLKIYPDGEIDYTLFAVKEEDIPMQEGTGADGEVQYDPSRNEESAEALPGEM